MRARWRSDLAVMAVIVSPIAFFSACLFILFECSEPTVAEVEVSFSNDEFHEYVNYYSVYRIPMDGAVYDTKTIFLITKGAEMLARESGEQLEVSLTLRKIIHVSEIVKNLTYKYLLFVEDLQHRNVSRLTVIGKLGFSENMSSISASVLSSDFSSSFFKICDQISQLANCTKCTELGRCEKGHVPLDPWLKFALKTQREIQVDKVFTQFQFLEAHNAYNDRADMYGVLDDCKWPPPYRQSWVCLANQEFSFTDLLDIGVHALELDTWWCFGKIRLSHCTKRALGCSPVDRPYSEGLREIGEWVRRPQNRGKVIRIYLEDGLNYTKGHDELVNGPIGKFLEPYVFRPSDLRGNFHGVWPTIRQLQQLNKTVVIATGGSYTHGGEYIHCVYWRESPVNKFTPYPDCGDMSMSSTRRYYSDSTNYGPVWNGPKETGVILDFEEFIKCRVEYPAADQVNPEMLRSAVYTWSEGEPSSNLTLSSCVYISALNGRWYVGHNCSLPLHQACSKTDSSDIWTISRRKGSSGAQSLCPEGYTYDVPNDGFKKQKLLESMDGDDTWINVGPYLPLLVDDTPVTV